MAGLMDDGWPPAPLQHLSQDLPPTRLHACQARLGAPGAATAPALCHLHASSPIHPITHRLHRLRAEFLVRPFSCIMAVGITHSTKSVVEDG